MKALMRCVLLLCLSSALMATDQDIDAVSAEYDAALAAELGADDYGMRRYVMAILKRGPNQDHDAEQIAEIQRGHMAAIRRMAEEGTLILAGPFLDGGEMRGIFLFNVASLDEAQALTATDPAVESGRLVMELHPWYGSAALMKVSELHRQIARQNP